MDIVDVSRRYIESGLSVVGCSNKMPVTPWTELQSRYATENEVLQWQSRSADQIAIICGEVSGSSNRDGVLCAMEVIDIDAKYHLKPKEFVKDLMENLKELFGEDISYLPMVQTKSGGYHIYYRCEVVQGNKKLAHRHPTEKELKENPKLKKVCFIETRGEGGYVIAPPSDQYNPVPSMGSLTEIPILEIEEREALMELLRSYNEYIVEEITKPKKVSTGAIYEDTPWAAYDQTDEWMDVLKNNGWTAVSQTNEQIFWRRPGSKNKQSANWHKGKRLFYVFSGNTAFEPEKAYAPNAIYAILEHDGDFGAAARSLSDLGYGKVWSKRDLITIDKVAQYKIDGYNWQQIVDAVNDLDGISDDKQEKIEHAAEAKNIAQGGIFWKKTKKGGIIIDKWKLSTFMAEKLLIRLVSDRKDSSDYIITITEDRFIYEAKLYDVKQKVYEWIRSFVSSEQFIDYNVHEEHLKRGIADITDSAWRTILELVPRIDFKSINILKDTSNTSYQFFLNYVIKITGEKIEYIHYSELPENSLIWKSRVHQMNISPIGEQIFEEDLNKSVFLRFVKRLAGITGVKETVEYEDEQSETIRQEELLLEELKAIHPDKHHNFMSFITFIGYLCTNYKDFDKAFMVVLVEDTDNDEKGGGTGKGLLMQGIAKMRSVYNIDAKNWKPNNQFSLQRYDFGTDIVFINDPNKYFPMDVLYNRITDGIEVEKKYSPSFFVPFEESPKFAMASNYDIIDNGAAHTSRRVQRLPLSLHFGQNHTPKDEFGHIFFREWDQAEWNRFYYFMAWCVSMYLEVGIVPAIESMDMRKKRLSLMLGEYNDSFEEWFSYAKSNGGFDTDKYFLKSKVLDEFKDFIPDTYLKNKLKMSWFRKWLIEGCDIHNIKCTEVKCYERGELRDKWCYVFSDKLIAVENDGNPGISF